jgi:signal transduction histidine kinase
VARGERAAAVERERWPRGERAAAAERERWPRGERAAAAERVARPFPPPTPNAAFASREGRSAMLAAVRTLVVVGTVAAALAGCGAVVASGRAAHRSAATSCSATVDATLRDVAMRIYSQAAAGPNVVSATRRLARSKELARAVERGDPGATRAALRPLLESQIHRIVVTRGRRVLADLGDAAALAPARGVMHDARGRAVGRYTIAVGEDAAIAGIIRALTGAAVRILPASDAAPPGAQASFAATAFPSGAIRVWLVGRPTGTCAATPQQTVAATIGAIATQLYRVEASGPSTRRVLRYVARDRRFVAAVVHDDRVALRAAIVRFFRTRFLHVVRVRATTADGRLVGDVGGPYVLAPASTLLRTAGGRVAGRVTLSVQDDTGYMKLIRRFMGVGVVMRTPAGEVPGSSPASDEPPEYDFGATAFPTGPLNVALLSG